MRSSTEAAMTSANEASKLMCITCNDTTEVVPFFELIGPKQFDRIVEVINSIISVLTLLGVSTNSLNIKTFISMGVKDGVTTSFLFLSIFDFIYCFMGLIQCVSFALGYLETKYKLQIVVDPYAVAFFGGNITLIFNTITTLTTTFIAVARCLCVAKPLQFKNMFTKKICIVVLAVVAVSFISVHLPIFAHMGIKLGFDSRVNLTRLVLWMSEDREEVKDLVRTVINMPLIITAYLVNIICVIVIMTKLRKSLGFRRRITGNGKKEDNKDEEKEKLTGKELQVVIQVLLICIIFFICSIPKVFVVMYMIVEPKFDNYRSLQYVYLTSCGVMNILDSINASVNFFIYYRFNSKFRSLLGSCWG